jgi:hypothetical protein
MIIGNRELAQSPGPVLARVWAFLGVKDVPSAFNTTQLNDAYVGTCRGLELLAFSLKPLPPHDVAVLVAIATHLDTGFARRFLASRRSRGGRWCPATTPCPQTSGSSWRTCTSRSMPSWCSCWVGS